MKNATGYLKLKSVMGIPHAKFVLFQFNDVTNDFFKFFGQTNQKHDDILTFQYFKSSEIIFIIF